MYANAVIESDAFVELSDKAKILWFYLNGATDDDGFCDSVRRAGRLIDCEKGKLPELLMELEEAGLIYTFPSGIVVIRHFKAMNDLKSDRYRETLHAAEMQELIESGKVYYRREDTDCIQTVSSAEHSTAELSIDKSTGEVLTESTAERNSSPKGSITQVGRRKEKGASGGKDGGNPQFTLDDVIAVANQNRGTLEDAQRFYRYYEDCGWMKDGAPITGLKAAFRAFINPSESLI